MDVPHLPIKKALCVGISYKGQTGPYDSEPKDFELTGAHTDVAKVRELLTGETFENYSPIFMTSEGQKDTMATTTRTLPSS